MRCSSTLALLALLAMGGSRAVAQEPAAIDARLSPDGATVAARVPDGGSVRVLALSPYDSLGVPRWITPAGSQVEELSWTPDGSGIVYLDARNGHLYVAPVGGDGAVAPRDLTPNAGGEVRLAGFAADGSAALVEMAGQWPGAPELYRVPLAGDGASLVQSNPGGIARWIVDAGDVKLAVREGEGGDREIARLRDGALVPVYVCTDAEVCEVVGFHPDGRVWLRSSQGRSEPALLLVEPITMSVEVARAELGVDPSAFIREDSTYARDVGQLSTALGDTELAFHGEPRAQGARMLVRATDAAGAALYVFDRWAGTVVRVLPLVDAGATLASGLTLDATLVWPERLRYRVSDSEPGMPPTDLRRTIQRRNEGGREVLVIVDETEVPVFPAFELDTALLSDPAFEPDLSLPDDLEMVEATDTIVLDGTTLRPIRRRATGPFGIALDFDADGVRGTVTLDGFDTRVARTAEEPIWSDGAALELLVSALPLASGYETALTYFDGGVQEVVRAPLAVAGSERVTTEAGGFDAWRVTIRPETIGAGTWTWWVRQGAPHTLLRARIDSRDATRAIELIEGRFPS